MKTTYRYEIPVDDQWHTLRLTPHTEVLHVAARDPRVVEFWIEFDDMFTQVDRWFRVFGTGQPQQGAPMRHVGSVVTADGLLVWHLYEASNQP